MRKNSILFTGGIILKITIQKAKNGEETALVENHFLHSNYSPVKEAERFTQALVLPYAASKIIITEPGLSYILPFLKNKFPGSKIGAIRYCDSFNNYNKDFDFILNYYEHKDLETYLESIFTEEELLTTFFTPWTPSSQVFSDIDKEVWTSIKNALYRSKTLLITRQYFEKKWFLNSLIFFTNCQNITSLTEPVNKDILIISSGPSLLPFIDYIKNNQNKFFILCLSSAITVCIKNGIKPDLCMSTDGGYWAAEHLKVLYKKQIPLAMPAEGYCKKSLLQKLNVLPLNYGDGFSNDLFTSVKLKALKAYRNGTVSGTALLFAATYFTKNIYLCGLDMACQKGFQHAQPNQLELNSSLSDNRIKSKSLRLFKSELTNDSLEIYKNWFINNPLKLSNRKVFRLVEEKDRKNSLKWIEDINLKDFTNLTKDLTSYEKDFFTAEQINIQKKAISDLLKRKDITESLKKQLFPLDYVQLAHEPENTEIIQKINNEWEKIKIKAGNLINADI